MAVVPVQGCVRVLFPLVEVSPERMAEKDTPVDQRENSHAEIHAGQLRRGFGSPIVDKILSINFISYSDCSSKRFSTGGRGKFKAWKNETLKRG